MSKNVSIKDKELFIGWFISNYRYDTAYSQAQFYLYYALKNGEYLENITFVDQNKSYETYLEIRIGNQNKNEMILIQNNQYFSNTDPHTMFELTLKENKETVYINLIFEDDLRFRDEYKKVIGVQSSSIEEEAKAVEVAENLLKKQYLLMKIDEALDTKNQNLFNEMTEQLKNLDKKKIKS